MGDGRAVLILEPSLSTVNPPGGSTGGRRGECRRRRGLVGYTARPYQVWHRKVRGNVRGRYGPQRGMGIWGEGGDGRDGRMGQPDVQRKGLS